MSMPIRRPDAVARTPSESRPAPQVALLPFIAVLAVAAGVLATASALIVPAGLPYDEPADWANVLFIAQHGRLPVVGEPGAQYEAQQTPVFYLVAAVIVRIAGQGQSGFLAVRLFGALGLVVLTVLVAAILTRITCGRPVIVVVGTAFVALNPMLIVMSASVQNDTWALVAGFAAMLVAMADRARHPWWHGAAIGALGALAILVKLSMAPLVLGVWIVLLWRRRFREAAASIVVVLVGCGWWVARNIVLYGDLTGQAGVEAAGYRFGRGGLGADVLAREALTYLTLPTEYLRNTIRSPAWTDAVAVVIGAAIVVGLVVDLVLRRAILRSGPALSVVVVGAVSVAAWVVQGYAGWEVAFRTAYGVLPLIALAYGSVTALAPGRVSRAILAVVLVALVIALAVWTGYALASGASAAMLHFRSGTAPHG